MLKKYKGYEKVLIYLFQNESRNQKKSFFINKDDNGNMNKI